MRLLKLSVAVKAPATGQLPLQLPSQFLDRNFKDGKLVELRLLIVRIILLDLQSLPFLTILHGRFEVLLSLRLTHGLGYSR